ncbi:choice-of-anchor Q domain-containing protein [Bacteroidota bacterium]
MKNLSRLLILGFLLAITCGIAKADFITVQDTIMANTTWMADTVKVTGNILVWDDVILTIKPGTRVEFQGHYFMYIHGTMIAKGTEQDTIVFTVADTAGFWNDTTMDGSWDGIVFYNGNRNGGPGGAMIDNDTSKFDYCLLEYTKSYPDKSFAGSAIDVTFFSRLIISNSEFRYNHSFNRGGAINAGIDSDIEILGNYIHHNRSMNMGGGIWIRDNACLVTGNRIEYNQTTTLDWANGKGGGIYIQGMNPRIRYNTIRYNNAIYGSGIYMNNCFGLITNNTISYNTGYNDLPHLESMGGGIMCEDGSTARINRNKISDNQADHGGGIYVFESDVRFIGNLIVNNTANVSSGALRALTYSGEFLNNTVAHNSADIAGAIELEDSDPLFMNNILWNNPDQDGNQIKLLGYFANLHIQNSVIQYGLDSIYGEGTPTVSGLIVEDPKFKDVTVGVGAGEGGLTQDWSIETSSPCVNAGDNDFKDIFMPPRDLDGNSRIQHTYIDIGAYEVFVPSLPVQDTIKTNTTWVADIVKVYGDVVVMDGVTLTILPGTLVEFQDTFKIQVIGTLIADGEADKPIHFTANESIGRWKGIRFENDLENLNNVMSDNTPSVLRYCHFSGVNTLEEDIYPDKAAVYVRYFSNLILSNCWFSDNSAFYEPSSLYLYKSDLEVKDCEFYNNIANEGPAIWAESSDFTIENCSFNDNIARNFGGAVRTIGCDLVIKDCEFRYNESWNRGGAVYLERTQALISHSYFGNNRANSWGGAICALNENLQLINNVIVNNTSNSGGGVNCRYVDDFLTLNNTVCNNWGSYGGGMYTAFANHTSINDIFYGNEAENTGMQYQIISTTADLSFSNTNLEGGTAGIGITIGQDLTGTYTNLIDSFPQFIRPTDGSGADIDGSNSVWRFRSTSPCINAGTLSGAGLIGDYDIQGNPRVFDTLIDLGAYESQYGLPEIQIQPDNIIGCEGDTVIFGVKVRHQSSYQWQRNGMNISGATENLLRLDNISTDDDGNYKCIISNSFGAIESNAVYLLARSAPEIIRQPEDIWAIEGDKTIISSTGIGTPPIHFQWYKNGDTMPGKTFPDLWIFNTDSVDEGRYFCEVSNACKTIQSDIVQLYIAPQICMVTVDSNTNDNLVIWEKKSTAPIESYNVYRESIVAGEFDWIGNVPATDLSVYVDTSVNPVAQAYIYKITAFDFDGNESDIELCDPHKTLHLLSSQNTETRTIQCDWDAYYGFDYGTFYIYRGTSNTALSLVHPMSSSTTSWIDTEAEPETDYYYRVIVEPPQACRPSGNLKAGTGPYTHSLSNMDDNKLRTTGLDELSAVAMKIYPNPFSERTTIEFPNPESSEYRVTVRDISGKLVLMESVNENRIIIERGDLKTGLYSIELAGKRIYRDRFIIK